LKSLSYSPFSNYELADGFWPSLAKLLANPAHILRDIGLVDLKGDHNQHPPELQKYLVPEGYLNYCFILKEEAQKQIKPYQPKQQTWGPPQQLQLT
jgi:hypothetical protein